MRSLGHMLTLSIADLRHDWLMSTCQVVLIAAVLTPLLLVYALKHGVTSTLIGELRSDPETLRLRPLGSYRLNDGFFEQLRKRPGVGFAVPATRSIAAQMYAARVDPNVRRPTWVDLELVPTAAGDPLAQGPALLAQDLSHVSLTQAAARELEVAEDAQIRGRVERTRDGKIEPGVVNLTVARVLPETSSSRRAMFVSLELLMATERYRDGLAVPELAWPGEPAPIRAPEYASLRLYAAGLEDVAPLASWLREQGIDMRTQAAQIEDVLALDRNLGIIYSLLGLLGGIGAVGALLASMVGAVERKRRSLAVLALVGHGPGWLLALPISQAILVSLAGFGVSLTLYLAAASFINARFADSLSAGQTAAALTPVHIAVAGLACLLLTVLPAALAGRRAARIEPSEVLREV